MNYQVTIYLLMINEPVFLSIASNQNTYRGDPATVSYYPLNDSKLAT